MKVNKTLKSIKNLLAKYWKKWTIFIFLAIVVYTGIIFYQYVYKSLYEQREVAPFRLEIKKTIYQSIMDDYLSKGEKINQIFNKNYLDPFK